MSASRAKDRRVQIGRNSPQSFLIGASWSYDPRWSGPRRTHIYLGSWFLTLTSADQPATGLWGHRDDESASGARDGVGDE